MSIGEWMIFAACIAWLVWWLTSETKKRGRKKCSNAPKTTQEQPAKGEKHGDQ